MTMSVEQLWNDTDRGKAEVLGEKKCSNATLSTTNLTRTDLTWYLGPHGERPVTVFLSHGTAWLKARTNPNYI